MCGDAAFGSVPWVPSSLIVTQSAVAEATRVNITACPPMAVLCTRAPRTCTQAVTDACKECARAACARQHVEGAEAMLQLTNDLATAAERLV